MQKISGSGSVEYRTRWWNSSGNSGSEVVRTTEGETVSQVKKGKLRTKTEVTGRSNKRMAQGANSENYEAIPNSNFNSSVGGRKLHSPSTSSDGQCPSSGWRNLESPARGAYGQSYRGYPDYTDWDRMLTHCGQHLSWIGSWTVWVKKGIWTAASI